MDKNFLPKVGLAANFRRFNWPIFKPQTSHSIAQYPFKCLQ